MIGRSIWDDVVSELETGRAPIGGWEESRPDRWTAGGDPGELPFTGPKAGAVAVVRWIWGEVAATGACCTWGEVFPDSGTGRAPIGGSEESRPNGVTWGEGSTDAATGRSSTSALGASPAAGLLCTAGRPSKGGPMRTAGRVRGLVAGRVSAPPISSLADGAIGDDLPVCSSPRAVCVGRGGAEGRSPASRWARSGASPLVSSIVSAMSSSPDPAPSRSASTLEGGSEGVTAAADCNPRAASASALVTPWETASGASVSVLETATRRRGTAGGCGAGAVTSARCGVNATTLSLCGWRVASAAAGCVSGLFEPAEATIRGGPRDGGADANDRCTRAPSAAAPDAPRAGR